MGQDRTDSSRLPGLGRDLAAAGDVGDHLYGPGRPGGGGGPAGSNTEGQASTNGAQQLAQAAPGMPASDAVPASSRRGEASSRRLIRHQEVTHLAATGFLPLLSPVRSSPWLALTRRRALWICRCLAEGPDAFRQADVKACIVEFAGLAGHGRRPAALV